MIAKYIDIFLEYYSLVFFIQAITYLFYAIILSMNLPFHSYYSYVNFFVLFGVSLVLLCGAAVYFIFFTEHKKTIHTITKARTVAVFVSIAAFFVYGLSPDVFIVNIFGWISIASMAGACILFVFEKNVPFGFKACLLLPGMACFIRPEYAFFILPLCFVLFVIIQIDRKDYFAMKVKKNLQEILDNLKSGIAVYDHLDRPIFCNSCFKTLTAQLPDESIHNSEIEIDGSMYLLKKGDVKDGFYFVTLHPINDLIEQRIELAARNELLERQQNVLIQYRKEKEGQFKFNELESIRKTIRAVVERSIQEFRTACTESNDIDFLIEKNRDTIQLIRSIVKSWKEI